MNRYDIVIQWTAWEASLLFSHVITRACTIFYHLKITWRQWLAPVYLAKSTTQLLKTWRLEEPGHRQQWYLPGYLGIFRMKQYSLLCHELPWHNPNWIIMYVADIKVSSWARNCCFDCDYTDVMNQPSVSDWEIQVPLCPSGLGVGLWSERPGVRSPHGPLHW